MVTRELYRGSVCRESSHVAELQSTANTAHPEVVLVLVLVLVMVMMMMMEMEQRRIRQSGWRSIQQALYSTEVKTGADEVVSWEVVSWEVDAVWMLCGCDAGGCDEGSVVQ